MSRIVLLLALLTLVGCLTPSQKRAKLDAHSSTLDVMVARADQRQEELASLLQAYRDAEELSDEQRQRYELSDLLHFAFLSYKLTLHTHQLTTILAGAIPNPPRESVTEESLDTSELEHHLDELMSKADELEGMPEDTLPPVD